MEQLKFKAIALGTMLGALLWAPKTLADTLVLKVDSPCFTATLEGDLASERAGSSFDLEKFSGVVKASCPADKNPANSIKGLRSDVTLSEKDLEENRPAYLGATKNLYYRYSLRRDDLPFGEIWVFPSLGKVALVPWDETNALASDINGVILNNSLFEKRGGLIGRTSRAETLDLRQRQAFSIWASSSDPLRGTWIWRFDFIWDGQSTYLKRMSRSSSPTSGLSRVSETPLAEIIPYEGVKLSLPNSLDLQVTRSGAGYTVTFGSQTAGSVSLKSQPELFDSLAKEPAIGFVDKAFLTGRK